jgi:hypothetical protein
MTAYGSRALARFTLVVDLSETRLPSSGPVLHFRDIVKWGRVLRYG